MTQLTWCMLVLTRNLYAGILWPHHSWRDKHQSLRNSKQQTVLVKHHSLTRVKFTALCKQLMAKTIYIQFSKQNHKYPILTILNKNLFPPICIHVHTHTHTYIYIHMVRTEEPFKIHKLFTTVKPQYDAQIWHGKATQRYATFLHIW